MNYSGLWLIIQSRRNNRSILFEENLVQNTSPDPSDLQDNKQEDGYFSAESNPFIFSATIQYPRKGQVEER